MKKKLYLITNDFPYGQGEASFIMPELPFLTDAFDVTIISNSLSAEQTVELGNSIHIVHYDRKATAIQKLWDSICYFFSRDSYLELNDILKSSKNIWRGIFESILFFEEARRLERFLKKNSIIDKEEEAVIYCYWFTYYCLSMAHLYGDNPKIKLITRTHRFDLYNEGYCGGRQPFKRQMDQKCDNIIFIAEHGRQFYWKQYNIKENYNKYRLYRLGVTPINEQRVTRRKEGTPFLLVSCAIVITRKRVEMIVDVLAEISDIDIKWVHFGDGADFEGLKEKCKKRLDAKSNIAYDLRGYVKSEDIMRFYGDNYVDAFITTTASEGCPVSVQEAMAYGIPIIGTAVAEIPFMIDGNGILLSENPSIEETVSAIRKIAHMGETEINAMRNKSLFLWEKEFNGKANAAKFVDFLDKL